MVFPRCGPALEASILCSGGQNGPERFPCYKKHCLPSGWWHSAPVCTVGSAQTQARCSCQEPKLVGPGSLETALLEEQRPPDPSSPMHLPKDLLGLVGEQRAEQNRSPLSEQMASPWRRAVTEHSRTVAPESHNWPAAPCAILASQVFASSYLLPRCPPYPGLYHILS